MSLIGMNLVVLIISLLILRKDRRIFLAGMALVSSIIGIGFLLLMELIIKITGIYPGTTYGVAMFMIVGMFLTPFAVGIPLMLNTRIMESREGKSLTAKLSLFFGIDIFLILIMIYLTVVKFGTWPRPLMGIIFFCLITNIFLVYIFIGYLFYSFIYQFYPVKKVPNFIIILGAGVRSEEVTPLLKSRLDKAIHYWQKWGNEQTVFIPSGGQGADEPVSEAFAMAKYLRSQQIADQQIIMEDKSTTTLENMLFSKRIIQNNWHQPSVPNVIFSTNNYHVLRGAFYARKAQLNADGIGAPTSMYFIPSAMIREYAAIIVMHKYFFGGTILLLFLLTSLIFFI